MKFNPRGFHATGFSPTISPIDIIKKVNFVEHILETFILV